MKNKQQILVTGASGFLAKNLIVRLKELPHVEVLSFFRGCGNHSLAELVSRSDVIFHLAGVNRSDSVEEFINTNFSLTKMICDAIQVSNRKIPLYFSSSTQADLDNPYGKSKLSAESLIAKLVNETGNPARIYRLPGIFGKWGKPNYNSVVATFCHNIANDLPIQISDPDAILELSYIDDVIDQFLDDLTECNYLELLVKLKSTYFISIKQLALQIQSFKRDRPLLFVDRVGNGLLRALYSTYISYLPSNQFSYELLSYQDDRGIFVEMIKFRDSGQISYFTVKPGVTRGSHYHHTKTEKFLVVSGTAVMSLRNLNTGETYKIVVTSDSPKVVESIPGWAHDITNNGDQDTIVMLWASESFDPRKPDCIPCDV